MSSRIPNEDHIVQVPKQGAPNLKAGSGVVFREGGWVRARQASVLILAYHINPGLQFHKHTQAKLMNPYKYPEAY